MSSGNASNFTILRPQWSTLSSGRPTQTRSVSSRQTSPLRGEWDLFLDSATCSMEGRGLSRMEKDEVSICSSGISEAKSFDMGESGGETEVSTFES